jgi:hypothetical protein
VRNRSIYRGFLIAAGLMAALVIIFSHSYTQSTREDQKEKTEHAKDQSEGKTIISAPAEALTQGAVVRVDEQVPDSVIGVLGEPQNERNLFPRPEVIIQSLFQTFLRFVIAPNAP